MVKFNHTQTWRNISILTENSALLPRSLSDKGATNISLLAWCVYMWLANHVCTLQCWIVNYVSLKLTYHMWYRGWKNNRETGLAKINTLHKQTWTINTPTSTVLVFKIMYSPSLLVAELLRNHLPQLQPEPISHFLGQVVVGAPAKKHDVRHVRKNGAASLRREDEA